MSVLRCNVETYFRNSKKIKVLCQLICNAQISTFRSNTLTGHYNLLKIEERIFQCWKTKYLKKRKYYDAIFILGAMGSGKTHLINKNFRQHFVYNNYAFVNTDEILELIDGFTPDKVELYYPIARDIAIRLTDWLLEERISFVAEGTCVRHKELEDYILRLKNTGYKIKVKKVNSVPIDVILSRTKNRTGRLVPESVIRQIHHDSEFGINKLLENNKESNIFDEF